MSFGCPRSFLTFVVLAPMLSVGGCDSSRSTGSTCALGSERCGCYGNSTCDEGLICRSKLCVEDEVSGVGGNGPGPTSGAGTNATGQGGAGNSQGWGGSLVTAGQGGATAVGMGGSDVGGSGVAGTSVVGVGGNGVGGTTFVGVGGTTVIGAGGTGAGGSTAGGTTVVGLGGGHTAGATMIGSGGGSIAGATMTGAGGTGAAGAATGGALLNVAGAGQNLIKNGDFTLGGAYWHVTNSTTTTPVELSTSSIMDGTFCITASSSYPTQLIGWPVLSTDAATLTPGATYSLSFRARATYSAYLGVKVAAAVTPWLPTLVTITASAVSTTWQQYRTTFVAQGTTSYPLTASTPIGLVFAVSSFTNGLVCLDDVVMAEVT